MRPALAVATRPEPRVVGQEEGDAALVLAGEHQKRLVARTRHDGRTRADLGPDEAQPFAPGGRVRLRAGQVAGHGMALAARGDAGLVWFFEHAPIRAAGDDGR